MKSIYENYDVKLQPFRHSIFFNLHFLNYKLQYSRAKISRWNQISTKRNDEEQETQLSWEFKKSNLVFKHDERKHLKTSVDTKKLKR